MAADSLSGLRLLAPTLIRSEAIAVLRRSESLGVLSTAEVEAGIRRLLALSIELVEPDLEHLTTALDLARRLGWTRTYDAEYVAVATSRQIPLLTLDARLARAVGRLIDVISPDKL